MVEPQSPDHVFDFLADDPIFDSEDDLVLDIEEDLKEDPQEDEDIEVDEDIPLVAALHAESPPISPPPLSESSSVAPVTADGTLCDIDALQGSVRTLVRGMESRKTEIITARNKVDRVWRRMDAFEIDNAFVEQATARVEDEIIAIAIEQLIADRVTEAMAAALGKHEANRAINAGGGDARRVGGARENARGARENARGAEGNATGNIAPEVHLCTYKTFLAAILTHSVDQKVL
nr:hypothetical protein [Tanacetum cinerariifolium]